MSAADLLRRSRRLATKRRRPIEEAQGAGSHLKVRLNGRRTVIPADGAGRMIIEAEVDVAPHKAA